MNVRHTLNGRRALTVAALTAGLVFAVAGCGDGGNDDAKSPTGRPSSPASNTDDKGDDGNSQPPSQNAQQATVQGNGISVTVTSAVRDQGGFLTVSGQVTNNTSQRWFAVEWISDEQELKNTNRGSLAGASLVDATGKKKYLILRDTQGRCLCTKFTGGIEQGNSVEWFAQFPAPPAGTKQVELQIPSMPPASLQISEGE